MRTGPRHPVKETEALLDEADKVHGWDVSKGRKYFRLRCPCGKHQTWVHLTPSNPNYVRERRGYLRNTGCWGTMEETP